MTAKDSAVEDLDSALGDTPLAGVASPPPLLLQGASTAQDFIAPLGLRSPHTQSILNSSGLRRRAVTGRAERLLAAEESMLMEGGDGVQLLAHLSRQPDGARGVAVLLHGWEGSTHSNYMLATGARLFDAGFDVFRLNFRDHGDTHHLNPGIFHSCRLDEVIHALADMQERLDARGWQIAGYSLGGNFALRVARHGPEQGLDIRQAFAVCPVIDPANVLKAMESGPTFYETYYIRKWSRSVRAKQQHYPERYDYEEWFDLPGLRARTEYFATRYYDFESLGDYLQGYSVGGERLRKLEVPSVVLTSRDDPVCPVSDLELLPNNRHLSLQVTRHGGHCGYLKNWKLESWTEDRITESFLQGVGAP
ncbi:MAG: alpha/beta fold hydrolase [Pseudomonadota bacterium]